MEVLFYISCRKFAVEKNNKGEIAFDVAVGDVSETVNKVYYTPQDEEMKAKCEAVKNKYNNLKSNYMKFELLRISSNSSNPTVEVKDIIAIYELGNSVQ